jgi:peptidoglycan/xylan/chitin deacetylase (PgdA/CDA1 family)
MTTTFPRFFSKQIARLIPLKSLLKISTPVFLPFYHVVSDEDLPHVLNYRYRNVNQFEKELDFYLRYFEPISLKDLLEPDKTKNNSFHISFDDGLSECAEIIAPILLRKGIPATFFINPPFIDNKELFHKYKSSLILRMLKKNKNQEVNIYLKENDLEGNKILNASILQLEIIDKAAKMLEIDFEEFLKTQQPYLTRNQLFGLQKNGFTIGAHSNYHSELWKIPTDWQTDEISSSLEWVANTIKPEIKSFAFPFTDSGVSKEVLESIHKKHNCDITFGTAGIKHDEIKNHFQRYPVENSFDFTGDIKSELVYFQLRKFIGKTTVKH